MLYFDEAGNSGGNLLDKDQPTYLLLSHNYTSDEATEILKPLSEINKAKELHFSQIKKYHSKKLALIKCLNSPLIKPERINYYVAHKEFMIAIQIVDQLIEPVLHASGVDIYQYGRNIATANMLHISGTVMWDKTKYKVMCEIFVQFMRNPTDETCSYFYQSVRDLHAAVSEKDRHLLDLILMSAQHLGSIVSALNKYTLDATLSCFNAHCQFWTTIFKKPFRIVFDQSKQIDYWRDLIDFLTNTLPEGEVGFGSKKYRYPLLIEDLTLQDSHTNIQLQLADVFASSLNYMFNSWSKGQEDELAKSINSSKLHAEGHEMKMWPSYEVTPEDLNMTDGSGINPLDFIADAAMKNLSEYNRAFKE